VLQRHVDVPGERGVSGDGVEQALRDFVRIGVEEADPLLGRRLDLREARQQIGKAVGESEILAVAGGVLADQVDLADALLEEAGDRSPRRSSCKRNVAGWRARAG
jgi:hypothetical protein